MSNNSFECTQGRAKSAAYYRDAGQLFNMSIIRLFSSKYIACNRKENMIDISHYKREEC